jgi:type VI secretion system protein ImpK
MNAPSSAHEAAPPTREPANATRTTPGMRDLLRDTALLVATLSTGGTADAFDTLRRRCVQLTAQFDAALAQRGHAADVRADALVAQCALLDETALRHLDMDSKSRWLAQPLQVDRFSQHDAGERVFERLEARMREASPHVDLLECYGAILGLGFRGRYAIEGEAKRQALMATLNAQLGRLRPDEPGTFITDRGRRRLAERLRSLSPWAIAGCAGVIALIVWLAWNSALDAQLAQLAPLAAKAPRP